MSRDGIYDYDKENLEVIRTLLLYFSNSKDFEKITTSEDSILRTKPDLTKGIYLCGNVGSGKSLILKIFAKIMSRYNLGFGFIPCDIIADRCRIDGSEVVRKYVTIQSDGNDYAGVYCFDDLGQENKVKYFGNSIDVMQDIIIKRYRNFVDFGYKTHFTSNLRLSELSVIYDDRAESRISEMCNVIVLGGSINSKDRRKK